MTVADRWPPIYDAEDLARCIEQVVGTASAARFYDVAAIHQGPPLCQGDIVQLTAPLPIIDAEGQPIVLEPGAHHWLVTGNTCDFDRALTEVAYTQLVPVIEGADLASVAPGVLATFSRYQYARRFYVPPWPGAAQRLRYADFLTPVGAEKELFLNGTVRPVARLTREAWILLHSCLIRFLCRDDGRLDPG